MRTGLAAGVLFEGGWPVPNLAAGLLAKVNVNRMYVNAKRHSRPFGGALLARYRGAFP